MAINFVQFTANLIIALVLLKLIELSLLRRNPDSAAGQALAFITG
jgi:hypothetical protein